MVFLVPKNVPVFRPAPTFCRFYHISDIQISYSDKQSVATHSFFFSLHDIKAGKAGFLICKLKSIDMYEKTFSMILTNFMSSKPEGK